MKENSIAAKANFVSQFKSIDDLNHPKEISITSSATANAGSKILKQMNKIEKFKNDAFTR